MNSMKRQKDMTPEDDPPPQVRRCPIHYWGRVEVLLIAPERIK